MDVNRITGADHGLEFHIVEPGRNGNLSGGQRSLWMPGDKHRSRLKTGLTQEDARKNRLAGIMSAKPVEIRGHLPSAMNRVTLQVNDFIQPECRIPMRNQSLDFASGEASHKIDLSNMGKEW